MESSKRSKRNLGQDEIKNLIPSFNPNSSISLNSEEWIDEVENVSALQNWTDEITMINASLRLEDEAKAWFHQNQCNWKQFKVKLVKLFPSSQHRSQYLDKLLKRHKKEAETFEDYANDVARMAKKCNFSLPTAISYIISGLSDANMRSRLIAYNCSSIRELLSRIQTITFNQEQEAKWTNSEDQKQPSSSTPKKPPAGESRAGFDGNLYINSPPLSKDECSDLIMTIQLEDVILTAFADMASKYTTLRISEFRKHSWKLYNCDVKVIGSRHGLAKVLGRICQTIIAGEVEMMIEILVVEDKIQNHPLILGHNYMHNPNVCVIKSYQKFEINYVDTPTTTPIPTPTTSPTSKKKKKSRKRNKSKKQQQNEISPPKETEKEGKHFIKEIIVRVQEEKENKERDNKGTTGKIINNAAYEVDQNHELRILELLNLIEKEYL